MKKIVKVLAVVLAIATLTACLCFTLTACNKDNGKIKLINIDLTSEQYAFGVKEGNTEMLNAVNNILSTYASDIEAIKAQYLASDDDGESLAFDIATESTNRSNELVVITSADFPPFEQVIGTGKFYGIDISVAKFIADKMNKTLVVKNATSFDALCATMEAGTEDYDLAMAALTKSDDREAFLDFTTTYFNTTQVILVKEDNTMFDACQTKEDLEAVLAQVSGPQAKCGAQAGTTGQWYIKGGLEYDGYENLDYAGFDSPVLAAQAMINGNISFVVVDKAVASAIVNQINK